jgi:uncharacterized protein (DUF697 family)
MTAMGTAQRAAEVLQGADMQAAADRVADMARQHPAATADELVQLLIKRKCMQAATVGAVTAGTAMAPGLGTLAALTFGMAADLGLSLKLQAELILEIAAAHGRTLAPDERSQVLLLLTGLNLGADKVLVSAGRQVALRAGRLAAPRAALKALPVAGVLASAGVNLVITYAVGQRAHAYFGQGPHAAADWTAGLRTLTGVDELAGWLTESLLPPVGGLLQKARTSASSAIARGRARLPGRRRLTAPGLPGDADA